MDPCKCKYFDGSVFKLTNTHRNYDQAGERCVEVGRLIEKPNTTLNLIASINGINHLHFADGANKGIFVDFVRPQTVFLKMDFQLWNQEILLLLIINPFIASTEKFVSAFCLFRWVLVTFF